MKNEQDWFCPCIVSPFAEGGHSDMRRANSLLPSQCITKALKQHSPWAQRPLKRPVFRRSRKVVTIRGLKGPGVAKYLSRYVCARPVEKQVF